MTESLAECLDWDRRLTWAELASRDRAVRLDAGESVRAEIARALYLEHLHQLAFTATLRPWLDGVEIEGRVIAIAGRLCGLSLEPFDEWVDEPFSVRVVPRGSPNAARAQDDEVVIDLEAEDPPDETQDAVLDLSAYAVEALGLALDPFPASRARCFPPGSIHRAVAVRGAFAAEPSRQITLGRRVASGTVGCIVWPALGQRVEGAKIDAVSDPLVISIDAMRGDHGPSVVLPGVERAAQSLSPGKVHFLLHGEEEPVRAVLATVTALASVSTICASKGVITNETKPAHAMRRGKGTSMWNAVDSVRSGEARAAVSAGNTGALMAISRLLLRTAGNLDRPALVANWPTQRGVSSVLDVGANVVCDAERLVQFAIMGAAYHRAIHNVARPTIGLLNVGAETEKGHEDVRSADRQLRAASMDFDYHGFVEGDDIAKGTVDVVITDGFTGNIALKTAEGLARFFRGELRRTFTGSVRARLGALIARPALVGMSARLDPSGINGGPFLGLNGIVVKSHGGTDAQGFATAIRLAANLAKSEFVSEIAANLTRSADAQWDMARERTVA